MVERARARVRVRKTDTYVHTYIPWPQLPNGIYLFIVYQPRPVLTEPLS